MTCHHCPSPAVVFIVGSDAIHEMFLLKTGVADRVMCLVCAQARGWPWMKGEKVG